MGGGPSKEATKAYDQACAALGPERMPAVEARYSKLVASSSDGQLIVGRSSLWHRPLVPTSAASFTE
jgi:hypothetical protein